MNATNRERAVPLFVVIDLDRTLLDTDKLNELLCQVVDASNDARLDDGDPYAYILRQAGKSFSVSNYLNERFGPDANAMAWLRLQEAAHEHPTLLHAGASQLLATLDQQAVPYGLVTYGEANNQQAKLRLVHAVLGKQADELPYLITDEPNKAQWIAHHWKRTGDSAFHIHETLSREGLRTDRVVIIDDKAMNTATDDPGICGILIDNRGGDGTATPTPTIADVAEIVAASGFSNWL
jgi:FMN phosphatase YigB (HAD superfamily)